jgi:hypothetical protein
VGEDRVSSIEYVRRFAKGPRIVPAYSPKDAVDLKARGYTEIAGEEPQYARGGVLPSGVATAVNNSGESEPVTQDATGEDAVSDASPVEHTDHPDDDAADAES